MMRCQPNRPFKRSRTMASLLRSTPFRILAIDPANTTGYAVIECHTPTPRSATVRTYGFFEMANETAYLGDNCLEFQKRIHRLIDEWKIDELAIESYFFSSATRNGANVNPAYRTAAYMLARTLGMHYEILGISAWKTFVAGRSTPTKEQIREYGSRASANKRMILAALEHRHGLRLPIDGCRSEKTHRPIQFKYDISDAIGQGIFAAHIRGNCHSFQLSTTTSSSTAASSAASSAASTSSSASATSSGVLPPS